ncbi:heat stress transcription factor A-1e [Mangifera indica]|uniref:heat stress transcription factor A-1e n=1 Tax=Mangifera indica TaxID=29780 RepID=UPI001CF936F4|nr:heat stress transcription factor A-1e [Mangifera indica]
MDPMSSGNSLPPFLSKIYDLVEDSSTNDIISWSCGSNSFIVWKVAEFSRDLLPKYFKHSNFSSFVRQLNTYGFRKVDPDRYEFANEGFLRGQKHLLKNISRRKSAQGHSQQPAQLQSSTAGACVEVGKYGLQEEVEILKRDKNVLMQELVRLRQQQQATDRQLQTVGQRVEVMEQRQQQMMSFLAKAMHNPGFLSQLVQQQNDSNRCISGGNKKRRLPRQDEENVAGAYNAANGQIIKFQPSMNEAAKAMLHQISKMNASSRHEPSVSNLGSFLIDNVASANALDSRSSSSQISGLTLAEVPPTSGQSYMSAESRFPVNCPSSAMSEIQGPLCKAADHVKVDKIRNTNVHIDREDKTLPNSQLPGIVPESTIGIPDVNFVLCGNGNAENMDPIAAVLDGSMPVEAGFCSPDQDEDILPDGISKLPGIDDVFWEQFFTASPHTGDTDEINSSSLETGVSNEGEPQLGQENGWDKIPHMNHLTKQMGLLASEGRKL